MLAPAMRIGAPTIPHEFVIRETTLCDVCALHPAEDVSPNSPDRIGAGAILKKSKLAAPCEFLIEESRFALKVRALLKMIESANAASFPGEPKVRIKTNEALRRFD